MRRLRGQTVFITGASSGIGAACARTFASYGARLLLAARRTKRLEAIRPLLTSDGAEAVHLLELDVRDEPAVRAAVDGLEPAWSEIDVLVNNAGLSRGLGPLYTGELDDWNQMIDTNIKGLLYVDRAVARGMVARRRGTIIHIGSIAGRETYPGGNVYCATKHAVRALTEGLRIDLNGTGVRVGSIDPGLVETEFARVRFDGDADRARSVYRGLTPLDATDVAEAVAFAASRPAHVNVADLLLLPTDQASATVVRRDADAD